MCSILSVTQHFPGQLKAEEFAAMFPIAMAQGHDAAGIAWFDHAKNEVKVHKAAVSPVIYAKAHLDVIDTALTDSYSVIGHVRWSTHGSSSCSRNAHPFVYNCPKSGPTAYVHNGVIGNYQSIDAKAVVDSEAFGPLLEHYEFHRVTGSKGLVWINQNGMFAYRESQKLYFVHAMLRDFPITFVVTWEGIATSAVKELKNVKGIPLEEGSVFAVESEIPKTLYHNPNATKYSYGYGRASGAYCGG